MTELIQFIELRDLKDDHGRLTRLGINSSLQALLLKLKPGTVIMVSSSVLSWLYRIRHWINDDTRSLACTVLKRCSDDRGLLAEQYCRYELLEAIGVRNCDMPDNIRR